MFVSRKVSHNPQYKVLVVSQSLKWNEHVANICSKLIISSLRTAKEYSLVCAKSTRFKQVAQLSQRDRAAGWDSYVQMWKSKIGRQYFTDIISLSSNTVT